LADGTSAYVPDRRDVFNGWGKSGSTHVVEPLIKPVPTRLDIRWFSYTEDKFYEGSFDLPWQEMERMFDAGLPEGRRLQKPEPYNGLVVGMAPGGFVAVWMSASTEKVEVAHYMAREVDLPWSLVTRRADIPRATRIQQIISELMTPEQLEDQRLNGVTPGLFTEYHRRYNWVPQATGPGKAISMRIIGFNGEDSFITPRGASVPMATRSVPSVIEVDWLPPDRTTGRSAEITFDEAEIFAAFRKLSPADAMRPLTLHLETAASPVSVSLRDDRHLLPLQKVQVKMYSA